jgi:hypothetical protein
MDRRRWRKARGAPRHLKADLTTPGQTPALAHPAAITPEPNPAEPLLEAISETALPPAGQGTDLNAF